MYFSNKEIETILQEVVDKFLIPKFKELKMNATGEWLENIEIEARDDKGTITARHYTEYLTKGRPPSESIPPISAIKKWVEAKFKKNGKQAEQIAWAVAHKIKNKGTKWYKEEDGSPLVKILESPEVIEYIQERMGGILRVKIQEQLIKQTKEILTP